MMMHQQSFDILDLKIRVPPHISQKFSMQLQEPEAVAEPLPEKKKPEDGPCSAALFLLPFSACFASMVPLFLVKEATEARCGCLYLLLTPYTLPVLVGFSLSHTQSRWFISALTCLSLLLGNMAAVMACSGCCRGHVLLFGLMSGSTITAAVQKLLLIHKGNVILVMISTASAVLVCCLGLVAPFLPLAGMTYRCYQSMMLPMLWLFWQALVASRQTHYGYTSARNGSLRPSNSI
jgi:hypothetical protein